MANWYFAKDGKTLGPVAFEQLQTMARTGALLPDDLIWQDGQADWTPARQTPGLFDIAPAAPAAPQPYGMPPQAAVPLGTWPAQAPMPVGYYGPQPTYAAPRPNNYLGLAIFSTVCCCIPFGIPSIVYAAQVNGKYEQGDIHGAVEASNKAKFWFWMAFWFGLISNIIFGASQVALNSRY